MGFDFGSVAVQTNVSKFAVLGFAVNKKVEGLENEHEKSDGNETHH